MEVRSKDFVSAIKSNPWATVVVLMVVGAFTLGYVGVTDVATTLTRLNQSTADLHVAMTKLSDRQDAADLGMSQRAERWLSVLNRLDRRLQADCLNDAEDGVERDRCTSVDSNMGQ